MVRKEISKIPRDLEDIIDDKIYIIVEELLPYFKKFNMTPNILTTLSFYFSLLGCYFLYYYELFYFYFFYFIGYFFDACDGAMARKYKMVSKFGDFYDHITDWITFFLIIIILIIRYNLFKRKNIIYIVLVIIFLFLYFLNVSCIENIYNKEESETLGILNNLCKNNPKKKLKYLKFFGSGTFFIFLFIIIYFISRNKN